MIAQVSSNSSLPGYFQPSQRTGEHERSQKQRFMKIAGQT
jgi:hypothetical protein